MDTRDARIAATRDWLVDTDQGIASDKFHVAKHLSEAIDKAHRAKSKEMFGVSTLVQIARHRTRRGTVKP